MQLVAMPESPHMNFMSVQMSVIEVSILPAISGVPPNTFCATDSAGKNRTSEMVYFDLITQHGVGVLKDAEGFNVRRDPQLELQAGQYTFFLRYQGVQSSQATSRGYICLPRGLVAVNTPQ